MLKVGFGAGVGRRLELLSLLVDDFQDSRLGQHLALTGAGIDPGDDLLRRVAEQAITGGVSQPWCQSDMAWGLPGVARGDLGRAGDLVLDSRCLGRSASCAGKGNSRQI
jgi:hypothetical protein